MKTTLRETTISETVTPNRKTINFHCGYNVISNIKTYNRALSQEEITRLYEKGS